MAVSIVLGGCKKETDETINQNSYFSIEKKNVSSHKMVFNDAEEYVSTIRFLYKANHEERIAWEESKGFVSLGRASDEMYLSLNKEKLTVEDLRKIIDLYPGYFQLLQEENGEYTFESALWDNIDRYLVNKDMIYQIGNTVYKVLNSGTVSSSLRNEAELKLINDFNIESYQNKPQYNINWNSRCMKRTLKDSENNFGRFCDQRSTNNNDRTYLQINISSANLPGPPNSTLEETKFLVRPYKKILGIWYFCQRTISCNIVVVTDYPFYTTSNSFSWLEHLQTEYYEPGKEDYVVSGVLSSSMISLGFYASPITHFAGYDCWGDTPSTNPVVISINTQIIE